MSDAPNPEREPKIGGPVDPAENLYISRRADDEFLDLLRAGEFVNVITSRQMGKTSLVYRAMAELAPQGYRFAYFDLSRLRNEPQARHYFRTLLSEFARELALAIDLDAFWAQNEQKANGQIFVDFFRIALGALTGPVVVVLDEIDSTLESAELSFTDDLFTAIRSLYTLRPREALFKRLTFCLVGVATPNELIKARRTTPYNIGRTIWLGDFEPGHDDLAPLARALSGDPAKGEALLARVLHWTGGQPYLTMWMCDELRRAGAADPTAVDSFVEHTFISLERLRGDAHFEQAQRFLNERGGGGAESLDLYERILRGAREADQPANSVYAHLKLSGLIKRDADGVLVVRNPIYARLFDLEWVRRSRPRRELRKARRVTYAAVALLVLGLIAGLAYYQTEVAPLKAQEQARSALKDLGVEVSPFDDARGRMIVSLADRSGRGEPQSILQGAAPHLASLAGGSQSKGLVLELGSTSITDLSPLAAMRGLRSLNVSGTKVSTLAPLDGMMDLEHLDVSRTSVTDLAPLRGLVHLESLDVSRTEVGSLAPLAGLSRLRELSIAEARRVEDLAPLSGLVGLTRLDVSRTAVRDLAPLAHAVSLQYLNLSGTKVVSLAPLDALADLRMLEIDGLGIAQYGTEGRRARLRVFGALANARPPVRDQPGQTLRDCDQCPEMVVVPAGSFTMGSPNDEQGRFSDEGPQRRVAFVRAFAVGKYEVTFDEWDACVAAGGCKHRPDDNGWGRGRQPVINVSWEDAQAYAAWLSKRTGADYRLLSEAEWEHAARAGTRTRYPWGDEPGENQANLRGSGSRWSAKQTAPVGSFPPNAFGLHDMIGNVLEWVEDCYHPDYRGAPDDDRPWAGAVCGQRVVRGGSWLPVPEYARVAIRFGSVPGIRDVNLGFRLARTL